MDLFDLPFVLPSLEFDDQLFNDDFLQLLTSDLAMDDIPLPALSFESPAASGSHQSDTTNPALSPPSPVSQPHSSCGESERPILLKNTKVVRGPKARPTTPGLPALTSAATGLGLGVCRTVTTDVQLLPPAPPAAAAALPPMVPAFAAWEAPLSHKSSGDGSNLGSGVRVRRNKKQAVHAIEELEEDVDDSDDSNDTDEEMEQGESTRPACGSKRKSPDVDWRAIADPAERRRQRRLAKNRVTAARSRERKKSQWAVMEAAQQKLEAENAALREALHAATKDNHNLRAQLEEALGCNLSGKTVPSLPGTAAASDCLKGNRHTTEPAVLVLIATLLTVCVLTLPSDQAAAVFGSAAAALLLLKGLQSTSRSFTSLSSVQGAAKRNAAQCAEELQAQQEAAAVSGRKKARTRTSTIKTVATSTRGGAGVKLDSEIKLEPQVKMEPQEIIAGIGHAWATAVCVVGKVSKVASRGPPKMRTGFVPAGLFV